MVRNQQKSNLPLKAAGLCVTLQTSHRGKLCDSSVALLYGNRQHNTCQSSEPTGGVDVGGKRAPEASARVYAVRVGRWTVVLSAQKVPRESIALRRNFPENLRK